MFSDAFVEHGGVEVDENNTVCVRGELRRIEWNDDYGNSVGQVAKQVSECYVQDAGSVKCTLRTEFEWYIDGL